jgi:hypothetical protein
MVGASVGTSGDKIYSGPLSGFGPASKSVLYKLQYTKMIMKDKRPIENGRSNGGSMDEEETLGEFSRTPYSTVVWTGTKTKSTKLPNYGDFEERQILYNRK